MNPPPFPYLGWIRRHVIFVRDEPNHDDLGRGELKVDLLRNELFTQSSKRGMLVKSECVKEENK